MVLQLTLSCGERRPCPVPLPSDTGYNLCAPAESDHRFLDLHNCRTCYNSRSPAESDLRFDRVCRAPHRRYNSRSPAESDDDICEEDMRDIATTHALLRRATVYSTVVFSLLQLQLTLAVEPLDDALATTHALLRRATGEVPCPGIFVAATTHALLRRATAA